MIKFGVGLAIVLASLPMAASAASPDMVGEVVVTAEKRDYNPNATPHVTFVRRADNLITEVNVVCDTRDPKQRREELKATLLGMIKGAGPGSQIEMGVGDQVIGRFDPSMLDAVIEPDNKVDTSRATVVVKTHIMASDTFDSATGRITAFIEHTPKVGRSEVLREKEWSLTIINPEQYRATILTRIADDARATASAFGAGYGVSVDGLQRPIDWYQSGPLDLALFVSYKLTVVPLPH